MVVHERLQRRIVVGREVEKGLFADGLADGGGVRAKARDGSQLLGGGGKGGLDVAKTLRQPARSSSRRWVPSMVSAFDMDG